MTDLDKLKGSIFWQPRKENPMLIDISFLREDGTAERIFGFFLGEAMELAGKDLVMAHVRACDNSPWVKNWHENAFAKQAKVWRILSDSE